MQCQGRAAGYQPSNRREANGSTFTDAGRQIFSKTPAEEPGGLLFVMPDGSSIVTLVDQLTSALKEASTPAELAQRWFNKRSGRVKCRSLTVQPDMSKARLVMSNKYRAYQKDKDGRVIGLPDIIHCGDD
jgi:hypothetical protein